MFFVDRLSTLVTEFALQHLPYVPATVITPTETPYNGKTLDAQVRVTNYKCSKLNGNK